MGVDETRHDLARRVFLFVELEESHKEGIEKERLEKATLDEGVNNKKRK